VAEAAAAGLGAGALAAGVEGDQGGQREMPVLGDSLVEMLKEAWERTKGAKGVIWKGSAVMYLSIFALIGIGELIFPGAEDSTGVATAVGATIFQAAVDFLSVLFTAGLLYIGVRRAVDDPIEWRMVFEGFATSWVRILIATVLQSILITIGFLLLIIPGIYLSVGYCMTLPLIVVKGMSSWEAMEASRKAVHKIWWKVFGLMLVMGGVIFLSVLPLGIGLIWTWPMFIILAGVVYRHLYGESVE
jgi:hypothetical protein